MYSYMYFIVIPYEWYVHLVVILIWQFGGFNSNCQMKITANTVVLSQVLINSNDE